MRQGILQQQMINVISRPLFKPNPFTWHILQLLAMMAGAATAALGLSVIAGWHLHSETLLQLHPSYAPMQYNAALNFVLCGSGLLALTCSMVSCRDNLWGSGGCYWPAHVQRISAWH